MKVQYDKILRQTQKALELKFGESRVWIPLSQIAKEDLTWQILDLPEWLVKAKELQNYTVK